MHTAYFLMHIVKIIFYSNLHKIILLFREVQKSYMIIIFILHFIIFNFLYYIYCIILYALILIFEILKILNLLFRDIIILSNKNKFLTTQYLFHNNIKNISYIKF